MRRSAIFIRLADRRRRAVLTLPEGRVRGGVIPLHPADDPSRDQLLFRHLSEVLSPLGIAVLRFDRRPKQGGQDVALSDQADDALAALQVLRVRLGAPELPLGLWALSQGAWAAALAAARSRLVGFLILIACAGVSPAVQMRYGTAEHLRLAGYGAQPQAEAVEVRRALEDATRGAITRTAAQEVVDRYAARPWFPMTWVPRRLPPQLRWADMDFDPRPTFASVKVPTLLFYGETDEWTPVDPSIESWRASQAVSGNGDVTVVRLPGATHAPVLGGRVAADAISPDYTHAMTSWLERILSDAPPAALAKPPVER